METVTRHPSALLNKWLRDHPRANTAHRVLRYQGDILITYCGRHFPMAEASEQGGVVMCPQCLTMSRRRDADQLRVLHGTYTRRPHNGSR
jgi:late competence protein required for DNA uptake (superfamily II DNA/RNA helicase)